MPTIDSLAFSIGNFKALNAVEDPEIPQDRFGIPIDINRPKLKIGVNQSMSTELNITIQDDTGHVVLPTIINGEHVTNEKAYEHYRNTGENHGIYATAEQADYASINRLDDIEPARMRKSTSFGSSNINDIIAQQENIVTPGTPEFFEETLNQVRAIRNNVGGVYVIPGDKPTVVLDPLAEELANAADPSFFDALGQRADQIKEDFVERPISSTLGIFPNPAEAIRGVAGGAEFVASMTTDLFGAFTGVTKTLIENHPFMLQYQTDDDPFADQFVHNVESTRELFRYEPRTENGKALMGLASMTFGEIAKLGEEAGEIVFQNTEALPPEARAALAAIVRIIPEAIVMLGAMRLGGKKVGKLSEVFENSLAKRMKGEDVIVFKEEVLSQFPSLTVDQLNRKQKIVDTIGTLRQKTRADRTPEENALLQEAQAQLKEINILEYKVSENTLKTTMKPDEVLQNASPKQLKAIKEEVIVTTARDGTNKPVEIFRDETADGAIHYEITSGLNELAAAKLIAPDKPVPVIIRVKKMTQSVVDELAGKAARVQEDSIAQKIAIEKKMGKSWWEKAAEMTFDTQASLFMRLKKQFGKDAAPAIHRIDQLRRSSTSGLLFVKQAMDDIFKGLDTDIVLARRVTGPGLFQNITEALAFDKIAMNRVLLEIAKRQPDHVFPRNQQPLNFKADLIKLEQELGAARYKEIHNAVSQLIGEARTGKKGLYQELLARRLDAGLISKKQYDTLVKYDYEPKRFLQSIDPIVIVEEINGRRIEQHTSGVEFLGEGSRSLLDMSAQEAFFEASIRAHKQIATNMAIQSLAKLADSHPKNGLITRTTEKGQLPQGTMKIEFFEEGQKSYLAVDGSVGNLLKFSSPEMTQMLASVAKWVAGVPIVKASAVGLNPTFFITDFPRNVGHMMLAAPVTLTGKRLYSSAATDWIPVAGPAFRAAKVTTDMASVTVDSIFRKGLFLELAKENAFPSFLADVARQEVRSLFGKKFEKTGNALAWLNQTSEIMMRMSVAQRTLKAQKRAGEPRNMTEAAFEAARLIDYGQFGHLSKVVDLAIPFFNPAVQATRTGLRGFKEAPITNSAFMLNNMAMAGAVYMWNSQINEQAMIDIPDDKLASGLVFVLPRNWSTVDSKNNLVHPYFHIPFDNVYMPFIGGTNWFMRYALTKRIPSRPIRDMMFLSIPGGPATGSMPPTLDALLKMRNLDFWKDSDVFPNAGSISKFEEHFPVSDRRMTPRQYIWWAERLVEVGVVGEWTPEWGKLDKNSIFASPERTRALVDGFFGSHMFSHLWSETISPMIWDQGSYKEGRPIDLAIAAQPGLRRILKFTHPSVNAFRDSREEPKEFADMRHRMNNDIDDMTLEIAQGRMTFAGAAKSLYTTELPPDMIKSGNGRLKAGEVLRRVLSKISMNDRIGLPDPSWWQNTAGISDPRDRARSFFDEWKKKNSTQRDRMYNMARQMSRGGLGWSFFDKQNLFLREFRELKQVEGTESEPTLFEKTVDAITPWLKEHSWW